MLTGLSCFVVYLASLQPPGAYDSIPARLLPFSILRDGNLDLDEFGWLTADESLPYFLRRGEGGHVVSRYPVATALLALPLTAPAVWWLEHNEIDDGDIRFRLAALVSERLTAATMMAVSVALLLLTLRRLTRPAIAIGIALVYGLGSSTWSTSSQALWQHGLAELSLAGLSLALIGVDKRRNATIAGAFAALGALARPTMGIFALLALVYVWREHRSKLLAFAALPGIGAAALLAYNIGTMSSALGGYADVRLGWPRFWALIGLLVSPNRGLLIFTPAVVLSIAGLALWRAHRSAWVHYLGVGCAIYLAFYTTFHGWWGGWTYGPRFLVDILPALALASVPACERLADGVGGRTIMAVLATWSISVQAVGVFRGDYNDWNRHPVPVDESRVWDWDDPQILRTFRESWTGQHLGALLWQAATDPTPVPLRKLPPASLVGSIAVEEAPRSRHRTGDETRLTIRLTNRSDTVWPAFSDYGFLECTVVYWWEPSHSYLSRKLALPRNLHPGETVRLSGPVTAPPRPGRYTFEVALVQLLSATSGTTGKALVKIPVSVE